MSKFQIAVLAIFVVFIIAGVAAFALYKGSSSSTTLPQITVWGTFPQSTFDNYVSSINQNSSEALSITYSQKSPDTFSQEFIAALARGTGPDAILISSDLLLPHEDKIVTVPFSYISQRDYLDTYIKEANLYLTSNGTLAIPFTVDPLVMYWNRDMFAASGIATYPKTWDEFDKIVPTLTIKDQNGNIRRSAIAMGKFGNIDNAREILGTLFLQSGNPVTAVSQYGDFVSTLKNSTGYKSVVGDLQYFTKFVDPADPSYSWNRSLPSSKAAFLSGTLATYFGFASELADLRDRNPNLNFDAAPMPQKKDATAVKATYGKMYGFSLVKASPNVNAALSVISILTSGPNLQTLSEGMIMPSVRTDVIAAGSNNPYVSIFNTASLVATSWLDFDVSSSRQIFSNMVDALTSGQKSADQAVQDAGDQYDTVLRQTQQ